MLYNWLNIRPLSKTASTDFSLDGHTHTYTNTDGQWRFFFGRRQEGEIDAAARNISSFPCDATDFPPENLILYRCGMQAAATFLDCTNNLVQQKKIKD